MCNNKYHSVYDTKSTRKRYYCFNCENNYETDPLRLREIEFREELKIQKKNEDKDPSYVNRDRMRFYLVQPSLARMMCKEIFAIPEERSIITTPKVLSKFLYMLSIVIFGRRHPMPLTPGLIELFYDEIDEYNQKSKTLHLKQMDRYENHNKRFPEEKMRKPKLFIVENEVDVLRLLRFANKYLVNYGTVENDIGVATSDHFNATIFYYGNRIINSESIDGFQDKLKILMQRWWSMGLYPADRKDYLDIPNEIIRSQLTCEIIPHQIDGHGNDNNNVREFVEEACVICLTENDRLVKLLPCNHRAYCEECVKMISKCSICLTMIQSRVM
jgi:hypothetical protein